MSKRILFFAGTRPEFIKVAPVIQEMKKYPDVFDVHLCLTSQHTEMVKPLIKIFNTFPDSHLSLTFNQPTLSRLSSKLMEAIDEELIKLNPDYVFVQGDTTTAMVAAQAAYFRQIPVGHIEAGLRSGNIYAPFPEEVNRKIIDSLSTFFFAPTLTNKQNLLNEGVKEKNIAVTGNTVIDALHWASKRVVSLTDPKLEIIKDNSKKVILLTTHRRESFGSPMKNVFMAVKQIALTFPEEVLVVYPIHLNPTVKSAATKYLENIPNIKLLPPLDYLTFVDLMMKSYLILSDSGGIQEEAPSLNTPLLILRETTERREVVDAGAAKLIGTNPHRIVDEVETLLFDKKVYKKMSKAINPFGDGFASKKIVKFFINSVEDENFTHS